MTEAFAVARTGVLREGVEFINILIPPGKDFRAESFIPAFAEVRRIMSNDPNVSFGTLIDLESAGSMTGGWIGVVNKLGREVPPQNSVCTLIYVSNGFTYGLISSGLRLVNSRLGWQIYLCRSEVEREQNFARALDQYRRKHKTG